jgi:drug/metabolite transporter (DMT)-like permease
MRGAVYAILSAAGYGALAILGKLAYARGMGAWDIIQVRFLFGVALLLVHAAVFSPGVLRARPRTLAKAALLGFAVYPVQSLCFMSSLQYVPAATSSLVLYLYPMVVAGIAMALGRVRLDRVLAGSLALSAVGAGLVFSDAFAREMAPRGVILALGAMLAYSCYLTLAQTVLRGENPRTVSVYVLLFAALFFNLFGRGEAVLGLDGYGLLLALGLGLIPTALAVSFLFKAVEAVGSAHVAVFSSFEPVATVFLAWAVLGEPLAWPQLTGMAAIVAGVALPGLALLRRARVAGP